MAEYYKSGECIDGHRVHLQFKMMKPKVGSYLVAPTGFKGIKYKCSRDGLSRVVIPLDDEEKKIALNHVTDVHLLKDDTLIANKFYFIAETKRCLNCFKVKMMSGQHECKMGKPDVRVYAEIEKPFEQIVHAVENKIRELVNHKNNLAVE